MYPLGLHQIILAAVFVLGLAGLAAATPVTSNGAVKVTELVGRGAGDSHVGWATYYNTETGRGACGRNNKNSEHVVAIGKPLWDSTQGENGASTLCGKTATVTWHSKSVQVRVVDLCPTCGYSDIDLSPAAFMQLADEDLGKLNGVRWKFD